MTLNLVVIAVLRYVIVWWLTMDTHYLLEIAKDKNLGDGDLANVM